MSAPRRPARSCGGSSLLLAGRSPGRKSGRHAGFQDLPARFECSQKPCSGARNTRSDHRARPQDGARVSVDLEEIHVESTLGFIAATWAIAMALGPILQILKIVEHRSSRGVSIGYFLILLVGFALWVAYGIASSSLVLVVPNAVAAVVIAATIAVALRYG